MANTYVQALHPISEHYGKEVLSLPPPDVLWHLNMDSGSVGRSNDTV
ncbi:MAG TPA: hypothetical protein VE130_00645 [Nitrososphaeraceae archaeon]|nr:hypothetical protein [Nitrososphaeraceae archaeon]